MRGTVTATAGGDFTSVVTCRSTSGVECEFEVQRDVAAAFRAGSTVEMNPRDTALTGGCPARSVKSFVAGPGGERVTVSVANWKVPAYEQAEEIDARSAGDGWNPFSRSPLKGRCVAVQRAADGWRTICRFTVSAGTTRTLEVETLGYFEPHPGARTVLSGREVQFDTPVGPVAQPVAPVAAAAAATYPMKAPVVDHADVPAVTRDWIEHQGATLERVEDPNRGYCWKIRVDTPRGSFTHIKFPLEPWAAACEAAGLGWPTDRDGNPRLDSWGINSPLLNEMLARHQIENGAPVTVGVDLAGGPASVCVQAADGTWKELGTVKELDVAVSVPSPRDRQVAKALDEIERAEQLRAQGVWTPPPGLDVQWQNQMQNAIHDATSRNLQLVRFRLPPEVAWDGQYMGVRVVLDPTLAGQRAFYLVTKQSGQLGGQPLSTRYGVPK